MSSGTATSQDPVVAAIQAPAAAETQAPAVAAEAAAVVETPPETTPPTTAEAETTTTTRPAAKAAVQAEISTPTPTAAPATTPTTEAPPAPAQSVTVPRLNPPSFSVFQAIQQLSLRIPLFKPSEAQARQFGDMVCSAFDQGKTYTEVRSAVLSAVGQVPGLSVAATDADFAIRTAVELFCPGHKSKLA